MLKTGLITIDGSYLSSAVFQHLAETTELVLCVFSRRTKQNSIIHRAIEAGPWLVIQRLAQRITAPRKSIRSLAEASGIPSADLPYTADPALLPALVRSTTAEVVFVAGCHHIFSRDEIEALPPLVNLHPSDLPRHRGPDPLAWKVWLREATFGLTAHRIDPGIDTGPIYTQRIIDRRFRTVVAADRAVARLAAPVLDEIIATWPETALEENPSAGSYHPLPTRAALLRTPRPAVRADQ